MDKEKCMEEVKKLMNENLDEELLIKLFYELLNLKVYIPMNEKVLLILNKQRELPLDYIHSEKFIFNLLFEETDDGGWLPIYLDNVHDENLPEEVSLIKVNFNDFIDERFINLYFIKGIYLKENEQEFLIDKDMIKLLLLVKKLKNQNIEEFNKKETKRWIKKNF